MQKATDSPEIRQALRHQCKNDIIFWIDNFVWQFNPLHVGGELGPFILWDFQREAVTTIIDCVEKQQDLRIEKSREMGASWLCLLVMTWYCLFHDWKKFLLISRDEDAVDRPDDPDALLWKVDHILKHLPGWMKKEVKRKKMVRLFGTSSITGEASTGTAGIGGRATAAFVDEFSRIKSDEEIFKGTADTAHCRIFNFTHQGTDTMAYTICFDPKFSSMRCLRMHWSQHPEKKPGLYRYDTDQHKLEIIDKSFPFGIDFNFDMSGRPFGGPFAGLRSPWYDEECTRRTDRGISMDLDIDPRGATEQFFDAYRINVLKSRCTSPVWIGDLEYNRETGRPVRLVQKATGLINLWIHPKGEREMPTFTAGAAVDIAAGTGRTPSCLVVGNAETGMKVLEYKNALIYPTDFAVFVAAVCRLFRDKWGIPPLLVWEIQGGQAFDQKMRTLSYENSFIRRDEDIVGNPKDPKGRAGFSAQPAAILALMNDYRDGLYNGNMMNPSAFALDECLSMVYYKDFVIYKQRGKIDKAELSAAGASVHHGDIVRADALLYKMMKGYEYLSQPVNEEEVPNLGSQRGRELWGEMMASRTNRDWD